MQVSTSSSSKSSQHRHSIARTSSVELSSNFEARRRKSKKISWADLESLEEVLKDEEHRSDSSGAPEEAPHQDTAPQVTRARSM